VTRRATLALLLLALAGCATERAGDRSQLVVPREVGSVYSDVELEARVAFADSLQCSGAQCDEAVRFRRHVEALGRKLATAAQQLAAEQGRPVPPLRVSLPGKSDIGTLSSASGSIIVLDGVRSLQLDDAALAFVIGREMGHVIAQHHEENTATGLAVSLAVAVLFPVTGLFQGLEAAYTASTVSTATSFAGARAVRSMYVEDQRREADSHGLLIAARAGWPPREVARGLATAAPRLAGETWLAELQASSRWLAAIVSGPPDEARKWPVAAGESLHETYGPEFDPATLWLTGLLYGAPGIDRLCPARLPLPYVAPVTNTRKAGRTEQVRPAKKLRTPAKGSKPRKPGRQKPRRGR